MKKMICLSTWFIGFFFFIVSAWAYQPFPDTGQTKCYNNNEEILCPLPSEPFYGQFYGQDAQYQPRLPRSYTKLGYEGEELPDAALHVDDGGRWIMTKDNVTGLIWQIKTGDTKDNTYSWNNARDVFIVDLNRERFGGYNNWRLPTVKELSSIVNRGVPAEHSAPKIDEFWFPNTNHNGFQVGYYTAERYIRYPTVRFWYINFSSGLASWSGYKQYVYAVRSESSTPPSYLIDNEDGTVTDPNTGLIWQKETAPGTYTWQQALAYAENTNLAGYSDWRIPNINELHSIVDYTRSSPAVLPVFVNDTISTSDIYWSSTSVASNTTGATSAKGITLGSWGDVTSVSKSNARHVRVVRAGDSLLDEPSSLGDVATLKANNIKSTSANIRGYIQDDGGVEITELRFEWSTSTSLENSVNSFSIITHDDYFYAKLPDLSPGTTYYFRALARNSHGWFHGEIFSFTTLSTDQYQTFPDTGQTKCYDGSKEITCPLPGGPHYGQDVQHQPRSPRSYTKLGYDGEELPETALHVDDGGDWIMTRDNVTELIWQIKTEDTKDKTYYPTSARDVFIVDLNRERFGGYNDWRLPTVKELSSLVDSSVPAEHSAPKIDEFWFPNTIHTGFQICYYTADWSSSTRLWCIDFSSGLTRISGSGKYVYAVRSESSTPPSYLIDNEDGTVTDPNTGLIWQKETAPGTYTWQQALAYAENLNLAGYSDWRIPNINELHSIVDYTRSSPAVLPVFVNDTISTSNIYWSSTSVASNTNKATSAKGITLGSQGDVTSVSKSNARHVRVVRAGDSVPVGSLELSIEPVGARSDDARWRSLGARDWKYSFYRERIDIGIHRIEFKDIENWVTPEIITLFVDEGEITKATGTYNRAPQTGSLTVTINPAGARENGARWRRVGTTAWRQSGQTETGVLVGQHSVEFRDIVGWNTPNNRNVTVEQDKTASTSGNYTVNNSEYQINAVTDSQGGSVFGSGTYKHNQSVTLTAVPDKGYRFVHWTNENGHIVSQSSTFTFLAREGQILTAHFEKVLKGLPGVMMLLLDE